MPRIADRVVADECASVCTQIDALDNTARTPGVPIAEIETVAMARLGQQAHARMLGNGLAASSNPAPRHGIGRSLVQEAANVVYLSPRRRARPQRVGLRVTEAYATNVEDLGFESGSCTLRIVGKGDNKPALIPLVPRTALTIDLTFGERHDPPDPARRYGQRFDRRTARRWVRSIGKRTGLAAVHPHMLRAAFIMAARDAGARCARFRSPHGTRTRESPRSTTVADRTPTATPPMSCAFVAGG